MQSTTSPNPPHGEVLQQHEAASSPIPDDERSPSRKGSTVSRHQSTRIDETVAWMASSEVDQKFLGKLAKSVEKDNPLLSSILFKILGLSLNLSEQLVAARRARKPDTTSSPAFLRRVLHILWLAREGLIMLQQYVIPMVGNYGELKVLAYKLRASFHHIFVLFHNKPAVSNIGSWTPEAMAAAAFAPSSRQEETGHHKLNQLSYQRLYEADGGPVGPPPGFEAQVALLPPSALLPQKNYLPAAQEYFEEAVSLAEQLLWGSHSLRLSVKTEYVAFLYECVHDIAASRAVAKETIAQVYDATEGMDDDMFHDACELVTVLGRMMKRGAKGKASSAGKDPMMPAMKSNTLIEADNVI